ncbi:hypothetical protein SLA2020_448930 [Shorea laevis]
MSSFDDDVPASADTDRVIATGGFGTLFGCRRCRFLRQSKRSTSRSKASRAEPTAIATIAAVESFLDFLWTGISLGFSDGDGAGDGKNGLHDASGFPQRCSFPANADAGNFF